MPSSPSRSRSRSSSSGSSESSSGSSSSSNSDSDKSDTGSRKSPKLKGDVAKERESVKSPSEMPVAPLKQVVEITEAPEIEVPAAVRKNGRNDLVTGGPSGGRTGGVYVPPFKLAMMRKAMAASDKSSQESQKLSWEALRKSINGLINKVNVSNIKHIIPELFQENLVRGRGLFARAIMKAQLASPGFTHIYSALLAIVNTKLPENGELVLKRVIYGFKRAYKR